MNSRIQSDVPTACESIGATAACLTSFGTLITNQTTKLDTLKTHKHGLMQGLYPSPPGH